MKDIKPNKELHVCMGLNSCKNQGYLGDNACAGQGDCATVIHACHTLNECKGQGGCGLFGTAAEFCHPGENNCKYQGSCGSPIEAARFIVDGPNRGLSVWQMARQRFEQKMKKEGKKVGPTPAGQEYGPTPEYLKPPRDSRSCGMSGNQYCSFAFDTAKDAKMKAERQEAFMKNSYKQRRTMLKHCNGDPQNTIDGK